MAIVIPWIGIKSTLSLVQASSSYAAASKPRTTAVAVDDLVGLELGESKE